MKPLLSVFVVSLLAGCAVTHGADITCPSPGQVNPTPLVPQCTVDLMVATDYSSAMGNINNTLTLDNYIINTVSLLPISPYGCNIGALSFGGHSITVSRYFNDSAKYCQMVQSQVSTALQQGMNSVQLKDVFQFFVDWLHNGRSGFPKSLLLFTAINDTTNIQAAAPTVSVLLDQNVTVTVVGVNNQGALLELLGSDVQVYTTNMGNYQDDLSYWVSDAVCINSLPGTPAPPTGAPADPQSNLVGTACDCNRATTWLDVMVVMDSSQGMGKNGLEAAGNMLATALTGYTIAQSGTYVSRVGIVLIGKEVRVVANLTTYTNFGTLFAKLYQLGSYEASGGQVTNLAAGMQYAADHLENAAGDGQNLRVARPVILLLASSYGRMGSNDADTIADVFKNRGGFVISVGYHSPDGQTVDALSKLSSYGMSFANTDKNDHNQNIITNEVSDALCFANCICDAFSFQFVAQDPYTNRTRFFSDCLKGYPAPSTATGAHMACYYQSNMTGDLVAVTSRQKLDFIRTTVLPHDLPGEEYFHIGLFRDPSQNNNWFWRGYNTTQYHLGDFQPWAPGFNYGSTGDCGMIDVLNATTLAFETEACMSTTLALPYICETRACDATHFCDISDVFGNSRKKRN